MPPATPASAQNFLAFRAVRTESNDHSISSFARSANGTVTKEQTKWWQRSQSRDKEKEHTGSDDDIVVLSPRQTIDSLVSMLEEKCKDAGAVDDENAFVQDETIQR